VQLIARKQFFIVPVRVLVNVVKPFREFFQKHNEFFIYGSYTSFNLAFVLRVIQVSKQRFDARPFQSVSPLFFELSAVVRENRFRVVFFN